MCRRVCIDAEWLQGRTIPITKLFPLSLTCFGDTGHRTGQISCFASWHTLGFSSWVPLREDSMLEGEKGHAPAPISRIPAPFLCLCSSSVPIASPTAMSELRKSCVHTQTPVPAGQHPRSEAALLDLLPPSFFSIFFLSL